MARLLILLVCLGLSQGEQTTSTAADDHTYTATVAEAIEIMRVRIFKRLKEQLQDNTNALNQKTTENTQLTQQLSELQAKSTCSNKTMKQRNRAYMQTMKQRQRAFRQT